MIKLSQGFTELAYIIGIINGDGHLQLNKKKSTVSFYSKDKKDITRTIRLFKKLFNSKPLLYIDCRQGNKRYKLFFASKELSIFLKEKGATVGNKTNTKYLVPNWIFKGDKELKRIILWVFTIAKEVFIKKMERDIGLV